jgi:hypothetical protein
VGRGALLIPGPPDFRHWTRLEHLEHSAAEPETDRGPSELDHGIADLVVDLTARMGPERVARAFAEFMGESMTLRDGALTAASLFHYVDRAEDACPLEDYDELLRLESEGL